MNFYFNFFKEEKNEYIKMDKNTESIKTNLENFNLKIFELECQVDLKNVTETTLVIEKENKGSFFHYKTVSGTYDSYERSYNYKDVKLISEDVSSVFRINLEFKENGIVVFNTKELARKIYFKPKTENFDVDVHDAKRIHDVFELQNENDTNIRFDITLDSQSNNTTSQYRYWFDFKEVSTTPKNFESLGASIRSFSEQKLNEYFFENQTYLHIEIRDVFGNIGYKKYKILAHGNTFSLFEIFNEPISINAFDSPIKLFLDYRNATVITPVIEYVYNKTLKRIKSSKQLGEAHYRNNVLDIKLSDHFEQKISEESNKFNLFFEINNNEESASSVVTIIYDNKKPLIKLSNLDDENYMLIVDDKNHQAINGMVFDDSLFYVGSENRKCGFANVDERILIHSLYQIDEIIFANGEKPYVYKYGEYYLVEDKGGVFEIKNEGVVVPVSRYTYIRNTKITGKKHFYITLDKNKLSNYEKNIIENQGGLNIKGPLSVELHSQEFIKFSHFYIVKGIVDNSKVQSFSFGLGIDEFEYDFAKYVYDNNVSCKISKFKEISLDFTETKFIFIASSAKNEIITFNNHQKLKRMFTNIIDEISFFILSKKEDELFTTSESVTFIDQYLNTLPYEKIHLTPIVKDNQGKNIEIKSFTMTEIPNNEDKSYNISMDVPIKEGENFYTLTITDNTGLEESINFILEKNTKLIGVDIRENDMLDSEIFKKDDYIHLVNNKDLCFVKVLIFNETRKQKKSEKYLLVKNGTTVEKHRIQELNGTRFVALYLGNSHEETDYVITYDDYNEQLLKIKTRKQDGLFLKVENDFIVGNNSYHLNFEKDDFSTVSIEYTNRQNFRCELFDNYVEVQRLKNTNFIEELQITFSANDKNGNYSHVTKTVSGKFYNETIVTDYYVENAINIGGKLDEPTFDLVVKSQDVSNILYIAMYDESELNVFNRKKISYFNNDDNCFRFKKITTPITPSTIKLFFYIKGDEKLILEKEIFIEQKIYYSKDKNKALISANETREEIQINFNTSDFDDVYSKLIIYVNDEEKIAKENVSLATIASHTETLKIIDLPLEARIYAKLVDKKGMITYSKIFDFDFNIKKTNVSIAHNFNKKLLDVKNANTLVIGNFENKIIEVVAVNSYGEKSSQELRNGEQVIDIFKPGEVYKVSLNIKDRNAKRQFYQNTIQVYNKIEEILELKNRFFEKIKLNRVVSIKNNSLLNDKDLNCYLSHYIDGNYVKAYSPIFENGSIDFKITKYVGRNKLILHYNGEQMELSEFMFRTAPVNRHEIYDIKIDKNIIYSKNNNEYILSEPSDITLKTKGLSYLSIKSESVGRVIEKAVADNFTCSINKAWIPCTITGLDENKKKGYAEQIVIKKMQTNVFKFPILRNKIDTNKVVITFRLQDTQPDFKTNVFSQKIEYKRFHPYLSFADSYAMSIGNKAWLKLEKSERDNIIKNTTSGLFSEEKIKIKIKEFIGGYNE